MHLAKDIAAALGGVLHGDGALRVLRATEPALAGPDELAVALTRSFLAQLSESRAKVALVAEGLEWQALGLQAVVEVPRGRLALAKLTQIFDNAQAEVKLVHASAIIDQAANIGDDASIGACSVIGPEVQIGAGVRIGNHVSIAPGAVIGPRAVIGDGCRIHSGVRLGAGVHLHANVVIGADGFSFTTSEPAHVETARQTLGEGTIPFLDDPRWHKIHSLGGVVIEDDVEIGANSTVDAGTLRPTRIGKGTKVDKLVQVGHNVIIGEHCLLCAQVGVAGSAVVGDRTVLGGKSGIADNIAIGSDVVIGGGSIVLSNVPDGRVMLGYPAVKMQSHIDSYKALRRLPRMMSRLLGAKTGSHDASE